MTLAAEGEEEWVILKVVEGAPTGFPVIGPTNLTGWQRLWYHRIVCWPAVFYPLVWFDCSVRFTRGKLRRFIHPPGTRLGPPLGPGGGQAGVRQPRRPLPSTGESGATLH